MAKLSVIVLMALAVGAVAMVSATNAASTGHQIRRSRFLRAHSNAYNPPLPSYDCSKKVCEHGRVCCGGHCVDLLKDKDNCGKCFNQCNKKCSHGFCNYAQ